MASTEKESMSLSQAGDTAVDVLPVASPSSETGTRRAVDEALSRRITRKCDIRLVPILGGLYFTAFLDRVNIANAKLLGFEADLHMPSNGYNTAIWVFFLSFVILEVPCNISLNWHRMKPNQWLGGMMFLLGEPISSVTGHVTFELATHYLTIPWSSPTFSRFHS
jgi:hypothetical protein